MSVRPKRLDARLEGTRKSPYRVLRPRGWGALGKFLAKDLAEVSKQTRLNNWLEWDAFVKEFSARPNGASMLRVFLREEEAMRHRISWRREAFGKMKRRTGARFWKPSKALLPAPAGAVTKAEQ